MLIYSRCSILWKKPNLRYLGMRQFLFNDENGRKKRMYEKLGHLIMPVSVVKTRFTTGIALINDTQVLEYLV